MVNKLHRSDKGWVGQEVLKVSKWSCRYWIKANSSTKDFNEQHSNRALDNIIESSDTVFKNDRTTTVVKLEQGVEAYVLKRYNARNQLHKFKRAFRRSRASRCWKMSYQFQKAGLNVAEPVLMYENRFGPIRADAYFINKYLIGNELLEQLPLMDAAEQQQVVSAISDSFIKMRLNKLSHGDMKASNLMWVEGKLFFIDLDASRKHLTSIGWKLAHQKDKKRFMKNWRNDPKLIKLFY